MLQIGEEKKIKISFNTIIKYNLSKIVINKDLMLLIFIYLLYIYFNSLYNLIFFLKYKNYIKKKNNKKIKK